MGLKWIESPKSHIAEAGWTTLANWAALRDDLDLDTSRHNCPSTGAIKALMERVRKTIHQAPDAVRYAMNAFIIAVGSYVKALSDVALQTPEKIGPVTADLGANQCQMPFAPDYIRKVEKRGAFGRKRKSVKC